MAEEVIKPPRTTRKGFIPLLYLIKNKKLVLHKVLVEFDGRNILIDGKYVQGFKTNEKIVEIKGEHYTFWDQATQIRSNRRIEGTFFDNFAYLAEPGKLTRESHNIIRKKIGCKSAEAKVDLFVVVPVNRVWIKSEKSVPFKFGVHGGLKKNDIRELRIDPNYKR